MSDWSDMYDASASFTEIRRVLDEVGSSVEVETPGPSEVSCKLIPGLDTRRHPTVKPMDSAVMELFCDYTAALASVQPGWTVWVSDKNYMISSVVDICSQNEVISMALVQR